MATPPCKSTFYPLSTHVKKKACCACSGSHHVTCTSRFILHKLLEYRVEILFRNNEDVSTEESYQGTLLPAPTSSAPTSSKSAGTLVELTSKSSPRLPPENKNRMKAGTAEYICNALNSRLKSHVGKWHMMGTHSLTANENSPTDCWIGMVDGWLVYDTTQQEHVSHLKITRRMETKKREHAQPSSNNNNEYKRAQ